MSHPLVLALFPSAAAAAAGARAAHQVGITADRISVVSRSHDEEGALAKQMDATPGADIEDSRPAAMLGELSGIAIAAIALVLPGIGPIVAAGPLSAGLGEAAGHVAGSIASTLVKAGVSEHQASAVQRAVEEGSVLLGVHATRENVDDIVRTLEQTGVSHIEMASWSE